MNILATYSNNVIILNGQAPVADSIAFELPRLSFEDLYKIKDSFSLSSRKISQQSWFVATSLRKNGLDAMCGVEKGRVNSTQ